MSIRKSYYKDYLSLHKNRKNRRLHFIGQWVTLFVVSYMFYSGFYWLLPIIPFVIYPFAWTGHYLYEKNEPAAFHNPIKAKISDWIMFWDILKGNIKI